MLDLELQIASVVTHARLSLDERRTCLGGRSIYLRLSSDNAGHDNQIGRTIDTSKGSEFRRGRRLSMMTESDPPPGLWVIWVESTDGAQE